MDEWEKYELHHRKRLAIKPESTETEQGTVLFTPLEKPVKKINEN